MKNRLVAVLAVLALALVGAFASPLLAVTQYGTTVTGGWQTVTGSAAGGIDLATPAATSQSLTLYGGTISSGTAGVHALRSGSTTIANIYLAANTPYSFGPDLCGTQGITLPAGVSVTISSSNTITSVLRVTSK